MKIHKESISIQRTGYIYKNTDDTKSSKYGWMVCHGYGQVADRTLSKFSKLDKENHKVISVEAPNRFYWDGVKGRPVTNWMTSRYRVDEIRDNNRFINAVYSNHIQSSEVKVFLGFSQGGTTLWRYILEYQPDFDVFINYAGWIPDELDLAPFGEYLSNKKLIFTSGTNDQYLTTDRVKALKQMTAEWGLDVQYETTEGDHRIDRDHLDFLIKKYLK